ncbi:MAG: hypothetical protein HOO93_05660 [Methyloglobulus sp.]|nr:hypothetical protein [Methyloglobulus sp.]
MTPQEQIVFNLVRLELKPEMIPSEYKGIVDSEYCGHCHHATIAMYVLLDGKNKGYKVRKAIDELQINIIGSNHQLVRYLTQPENNMQTWVA